jgi:4-hydroxy-2-oxoheptanedioate aldolase
MGLIGQTTHPDVLKVIDEAIAKIVANGKIAGALVNDGTANDYIAKGARFLGIPWTPWVANGARNFLNNLGAP